MTILLMMILSDYEVLRKMVYESMDTVSLPETLIIIEGRGDEIHTLMENIVSEVLLKRGTGIFYRGSDSLPVLKIVNVNAKGIYEKKPFSNTYVRTFAISMVLFVEEKGRLIKTVEIKRSFHDKVREEDFSLTFDRKISEVISKNYISSAFEPFVVAGIIGILLLIFYSPETI